MSQPTRSPATPGPPGDGADGDDRPDPQPGRLRFDAPRDEAEFRSDYAAIALPFVRVNLAIGLVFYASWGVLDGYACPDAVAITWAIRYGLVCPAMLAGLLLTYARRFDRLLVPTVAVVSIFGIGGLMAIIRAGGPTAHAHYFAGLVLGVMSVTTSPGLRFRAAAALVGSASVAYMATALRGGPWALINDGLFLLSTDLLALSAAYSTERHLRSDFLQRRLIRAQSEALREALGVAERAMRTDPLTGLANRRHFFEEATRRPGLSAVILLDIDHFKAINDRHGHATGDLVLREVSARLSALVRPGDLACRYGGEEFAVLLPGADLDLAATVAERLRLGLEAEGFAAGPGALRVTVSLGVAAALADDSASTAIDTLLGRADEALYEAKRSGRNRVRSWHPRAPLARAN